MAQNKKLITHENITEWLASTGFLFPRNEDELKRFEKLYGKVDFGLTGKEIDPEKIINKDFKEKKSFKLPYDTKQNEIPDYRMVASKVSDLPQHIKGKIMKVKTKPKSDSL